MKLLPFDRNQMLQHLQRDEEWDVLVIGGGATGLGTAVDAASRGYRTLLLEAYDFAKGTSSRSTKLVHGGVRYLAQGDIELVYGALHERGLMLQNAAHLVHRQSFIIPVYSWFEKMKYLIGLTLYDWLSGRLSFGKSKLLNRSIVKERLPGIKTDNLTGGIEYFDGQFDDARMAVNLAQTCAAQGGVVLNYCKVTGLLKENSRVCGVNMVDVEHNRSYSIRSKTVINATGVFVDDILQMDLPEDKPMVRPSQGVHIVLDRSFMESNSAMMIPKTSDGRVLFAVPWHQHVVVGTTDTPLDKHTTEPVALQAEIRFILDTLKQYIEEPPEEGDVLSVFAGLRPLAAPGKDTDSTKEISRDHKLIVSESGLITITGGKWTTYRKMAEDTVNKAGVTGRLPASACVTKQLSIHGNTSVVSSSYLSVYGTDEKSIRELMQQKPSLSKLLVEGLPYTEAEVVWAVQHEMARTVEDVLARRIRLLFLDAHAAMTAAPRVVEILAEELQKDVQWQQQQEDEFVKLAQRYLLKKTDV
ncbi:MAG: glycerol-3-phosphate dehydrogenase/oxidase [Chitinophagaceae bacterium]